jgi:hypothetical protein
VVARPVAGESVADKADQVQVAGVSGVPEQCAWVPKLGHDRSGKQSSTRPAPDISRL